MKSHEQAARPADTDQVQRVLGVRGPKTSRPRLADRVLLWSDPTRNIDRVLRWQGPCIGCGVQTWSFDDGENDPRGILGDSAMWGVDIPPRNENDLELEARACAVCANIEYTYKLIQRRASKRFTVALPYEWGRGS